MNKNDLLTDVFSSLRIRSNLYFQAALKGEFSLRLRPESRHIRFHMVREGEVSLRVAGQPLVDLSQGDIILIPNGAEQVLCNNPALEPIPLERAIEAGHLQDNILSVGEKGVSTGLLCGFYQFDEAVDHPVLANLPDYLVIKRHALGAEPWMLATLDLITLESNLNAPGMNGILTRLLEILFIQLTRTLTEQLEDNRNGFIRALSDKHLSKALQAIHNEPEKPWTITDLARMSGMSRAHFASQFKEYVGLPPIGYLTSWRLTKARSLLVNSNLDMTEIANRCGYASMPSFSSRFKKAFAIGPGAYRRTAHMAE